MKMDRGDPITEAIVQLISLLSAEQKVCGFVMMVATEGGKLSSCTSFNEAVADPCSILMGFDDALADIHEGLHADMAKAGRLPPHETVQ